MGKDNQKYTKGNSYYRAKDDKGADSDSQERKPISGSSRYLEMLEREQAKKAAFERLEKGTAPEQEPVIEPETEAEELEQFSEEEENDAQAENKKSYASLAAGSAPVATSGDMGIEESLFKRIKIRNVITCVVLGVIALIMEALNFRLPLMPVMMRLDMSAIPELIAAVGFGPLAGIIIIIVKNILYVLMIHIMGGSVVSSAISNVILDSVFVSVSSLLYARGMWSRNAIKKQMLIQDTNPEKLMGMQRRMITKCGLVGAVVTAPIAFVTTLYIVFPLVLRKYTIMGYTEEFYITMYNNALGSLNGYLPVPFSGIITKISSLAQGVLVYNVPITFIKLAFVALFVAIIFKPLSKILFYRPTVEPDEFEALDRQQPYDGAQY